MKLRSLLLSSIFAGMGYIIYKNRQEISDTILEAKETLESANQNIESISENLDLIKEESHILKKAKLNFQRQLRYFNKGKDAHLSEIKQILNKYKK